MFNSSPTTCSFGFGQSASSASPFGSQPGFGANTSLSNPNSFAPSGATPFGTSTAATMFAGNSTTGAAAFGQPAISSSPFGPTSVFGQTTGSYATATPRVSTSTGLAMPSANSTGFGQLTNSSPFGSQSVVFRQGSNSSNNNYFGTAATPFATSTGGSMFSGNSTGAFGASSFAFGSSAPSTNLPFSATFGTSAVSSTVFSQSPSSAPVVSRPVFGDVNKFGVNNSFSSKPVTATSFGSINAGAIFGGNSAGSFGVASSPSTSKSSFGAPLPFSIGVSTATTGAPIFNNNNGSLFQPSQSTSANHAFYSSSQSVLGSIGVLASGTSTSVFPGFQHGHSSTTPPFSSTGLAFSSNGASFVSGGAVGSSTTPIIGAPSNFNSVASNNHELQNSRIIFGQSNLKFGSNNGPAPLETKNFCSASQPTTTRMKSGQSAIDGQRYGSKIASYVATKEVVERGAEPAGKLFSISAMPIYEGKSHEELRFEDSHQFLGKKESGFIFQINEPSAGKTLGPTAVTSHSQPQTSSVISTGSRLWMSNSTGFAYIGGQRTGSKIASYVTTREVDVGSTEPAGKLFSISAMPIYKDKSHEELRFEDSHQFLGSKGADSRFFFQSSQPSAVKINAFPGPTVVSSHSQPEASSAISTGAEILTSNSNGFVWPKHEPITAPQITRTVVATDGASTSISEQSCAAMDTATCHQNAGMQQSGFRSPISLKSVVPSPFGMESRIQMPVGGTATTTTVQYGISCIPVSDKPAPARRNSLLAIRCSSLSRNRPSVEKYQPKSDSQKVPFYEEKLPGIFNVGASFIPRENARSWVLNSVMERPLKTNSGHSSLLKEESTSTSEIGNFDAAVEAILPKLQYPDYYIKPPVQELAAKERAEPGFCCRVKDFVVGREGYGSIRFLGETDVRNLDVESVVQFNYREVIVYRDTTKKPQAGEGLNKPAEVTILNLKCIDNRTGKQYVDGTRVHKWIDMLIRKAEEQDAEFLSYDPVTGEWKLRVQHF